MFAEVMLQLPHNRTAFMTPVDLDTREDRLQQVWSLWRDTPVSPASTLRRTLRWQRITEPEQTPGASRSSP